MPQAQMKAMFDDNAIHRSSAERLYELAAAVESSSDEQQSAESLVAPGLWWMTLGFGILGRA